MPKFTPIERRLLHTLNDGLRHTKRELFPCLNDHLAEMSTIKVHIYRLRKKLNPIGRDIVCETIRRTTYYRQVRLLTDPTE